MEKQIQELRTYIKEAKKILLLTHRGPDMDAFCSMLATYKILKNIHPGKEILMKTKQMPTMNLPSMGNIQVVGDENYFEDEDLVIITDTGDLKFATEEILQDETKKIAFIDHHILGNNEENYLIINELRSSATEQVYVTFKEMYPEEFQLDQDIAILLQFGILGDTNRFLYDAVTPETFRIFAELKEYHPVDIEDFTYKFLKFPREANDVIIQFLKTLTIVGDMAYMYLPKDIATERNFSKQGINEAHTFLRDNYLRYIQGVHWGFIIKPLMEKDNLWYISFRSTKGYQNVELIAKELKGGGHIYASAARLSENNEDDAIKKVLDTVEKVQAKE